MPYGAQPAGYPYLPAAAGMPPVQRLAPVSSPHGSTTWPPHQQPPRSFAALSTPLSALTHSPLSSAPLGTAPAGAPAEMPPPPPRVPQMSNGYGAPPNMVAAPAVAALTGRAPAGDGPRREWVSLPGGAAARAIVPSEADSAACAAVADAEAMKMVQESREAEACNNAAACLHGGQGAGHSPCHPATASASSEDGLTTTTHAAVCAAAAYAAKAAVCCGRAGASGAVPVPMGAPAIAARPGKEAPQSKLPTAKVKMTELLVVITERLDAQGETEKAALISSTSTKYRTGEVAYAQAMAVLSDAIGRDQLVQEVTRLSRQAMAATKVTAPAAAGSHPSAQLAPDAKAH